MKRLLTFFAATAALASHAQVAVQSVNSGSIISAGSSVSVGEIVVVPVDEDLPQSGIIGIMSHVNSQLAVDELSLAPSITVYPVPTVAEIRFEGEMLSGEQVTIYAETGSNVLSQHVSDQNSVDLSTLSAGIYFVKFNNKNIKTFKIVKN